ncbi:myozenin-1a [Gambusia affinis]|uniref:myozenin-1a n=1 Tax=Gambusia affinis TaxID=33528 RepID=UPI000F2E0EDA|nr:myozenin-1a [Gambusia affinis]
MPLGTPAPLNKRKKPSKIITDLSHISQDEFELDPEASEFDLGTKIRTPKEIMLEELSLMKNRGSKMFKMRQQRVEKFIYENNPDVFTSNSMDDFQKFVPSLGGQVGGQFINVGGHHVSKETRHLYLGATPVGGGAPVPPPKPGSKGAGGAGGAGEGGEGELAGIDKGIKGEATWASSKGAGKDGKGKTLVVVKTYISPWEKAMKGDEGLLATLKSEMPGPIERKDLPKYKSFNRMAMPYGGFDKANQFMKFQLPETEVTKEEPEPAVVYQHDISCRPSFNRTPIGWVTSNEPSSIHMETDAVPFDGETDEL